VKQLSACCRMIIGVMGAIIVLAAAQTTGDAAEKGSELWNRTHRVFAYNSPRRARYPSVARNRKGELILLFTRANKEQEEARLGDVMMIQSGDKGETWTGPSKIYAGEVGEPRTRGTLVVLSAGKLVAAVAEMDEKGKTKKVCLLTSQDGGHKWKVSPPLKFTGVKWASPSGRLIEQADGTLLMPVEAGLPGGAADKEKTSAGLMRSTDGGKNWGDFSVIASDPKANFTQPTMLTTGDNSLVALVNRSGSLLRCESEDGGYHWSSHEQVMEGRDPYLVRIHDEALACVSLRHEGKWGQMKVAFSYDNAGSWRCERLFLFHTGTVAGHYGWPGGLALDADHILIAFGHPQKPLPALDGPLPNPPTEEEERIEVVFFERDRTSRQLPQAENVVPPEKRDRWERTGYSPDIPRMALARIADGKLIGVTGDQETIWLSKGLRPRAVWGAGGPEELLRSSDGARTWQKQPMNLPADLRGSPAAVLQLSSGRLLLGIQEWLLSEWNDSSTRKVIGQQGGYSIWDAHIEEFTRGRLYIVYSDDDGKTWQGTEKPIDISPFVWACLSHQFMEQADGTVVLPVFGCLSDEDSRIRLDSTGLFRSTDGGKSWGDFSQIAYDKEQRAVGYNEISIAQVSDKLWVAFMRTGNLVLKADGTNISRAISTDGGYNWSPPEVCFPGGEPQSAVLPGGGIAVRSKYSLRFTYDLGQTWTRVAAASGFQNWTIVFDNDHLLSGVGGAWQRIPAGTH